jgi:hypothetical protein
MPDFVRLDDLDFGDEEANTTARAWREAIENANRWNVSQGGSGFEGSAQAGYSLNIPKTQKGSRSARVSVAITTGSTGTLGTGKAVLRERNPPGLTLRDGATVTVLNPFTISASIPVGTIITVNYEGPDWILGGRNCP